MTSKYNDFIPFPQEEYHYLLTQFSTSRPEIFWKCLTLSVTKIKSRTRAEAAINKSKSSTGVPKARRRFFFLGVKINGFYKRNNLHF